MAYNIKESGARIRQLRIQNSYTQEKLAGALNIDRSLLSHVEAGKRGCSIDLFVRLSEFFNVSLDLLILGEEDAIPNHNSREQLKADISELIDLLDAFKKKLQ